VNKSEIRKKILKIRKKNFLDKNRIDFSLIIKILKQRKCNKKNIGGYCAYNYEIDIMPVLEKFEELNYSISLPKIGKKKEMNFFKWSNTDPLVINKFGIPEPVSKKKKYPDILLVPIVAYDKNLNRIGYGGGFYDRYIKKIKKFKKVITIGFAYSFQKIKKVPIDKYDVKLDFIINEKKN